MGNTSPLVAAFAMVGSFALSYLILRIFAEIIFMLPGVTP